MSPNTIATPRLDKRRKVKACRKGPISVQNKITWWLNTQEIPAPTKPILSFSTPAAPALIPATPEVIPATEPKKTRRRRQRKAKNKMDDLQPGPSPNAVFDASPVLAKRNAHSKPRIFQKVVSKTPDIPLFQSSSSALVF